MLKNCLGASEDKSQLQGDHTDKHKDPSFNMIIPSNHGMSKKMFNPKDSLVDNQFELRKSDNFTRTQFYT